jgi:phosphate/sulfate permease
MLTLFTIIIPGANDIANAIAPVAGILAIYQTGELSSKSAVPKVRSNSLLKKKFMVILLTS